MPTILVTGGTGYIGSYVIVNALKMLDKSYTVRTTIRNLKRAPDVLKMIKEGGVDPGDRVTFVAADLMKDEGWDAAVGGCEYVLHVASPLPGFEENIIDENEVIGPAKEGAVRVLRAARDAGVKRVVMTSSFVTIGFGHKEKVGIYSEKDSSVIDGPGITTYVKSKILSEEAAWEFMKKEGGKMELTLINPALVFGPVLGTDFSSALDIFMTLLKGQLPMTPRLTLEVVDVRDVAELHLKAMLLKEAANQRYIAATGKPVSLLEISETMRTLRPEMASKAPTRQFPDFVLRMLSCFVSSLRDVVPVLGSVIQASNTKAVSAFNWTPISFDETIADTLDSLKKYNVV